MKKTIASLIAATAFAGSLGVAFAEPGAGNFTSPVAPQAQTYAASAPRYDSAPAASYAARSAVQDNTTQQRGDN